MGTGASLYRDEKPPRPSTSGSDRTSRTSRRSEFRKSLDDISTHSWTAAWKPTASDDIGAIRRGSQGSKVAPRLSDGTNSSQPVRSALRLDASSESYSWRPSDGTGTAGSSQPLRRVPRTSPKANLRGALLRSPGTTAADLGSIHEQEEEDMSPQSPHTTTYTIAPEVPEQPVRDLCQAVLYLRGDPFKFYTAEWLESGIKKTERELDHEAFLDELLDEEENRIATQEKEKEKDENREQTSEKGSKDSLTEEERALGEEERRIQEELEARRREFKEAEESRKLSLLRRSPGWVEWLRARNPKGVFRVQTTRHDRLTKLRSRASVQIAVPLGLSYRSRFRGCPWFCAPLHARDPDGPAVCWSAPFVEEARMAAEALGLERPVVTQLQAKRATQVYPDNWKHFRWHLPVVDLVGEMQLWSPSFIWFIGEHWTRSGRRDYVRLPEDEFMAEAAKDGHNIAELFPRGASWLEEFKERAERLQAPWVAPKPTLVPVPLAARSVEPPELPSLPLSLQVPNPYKADAVEQRLQETMAGVEGWDAWVGKSAFKAAAKATVFPLPPTRQSTRGTIEDHHSGTSSSSSQHRVDAWHSGHSEDHKEETESLMFGEFSASTARDEAEAVTPPVDTGVSRRQSWDLVREESAEVLHHPKLSLERERLGTPTGVLKRPSVERAESTKSSGGSTGTARQRRQSWTLVHEDSSAVLQHPTIDSSFDRRASASVTIREPAVERQLSVPSSQGSVTPPAASPGRKSGRSPLAASDKQYSMASHSSGTGSGNVGRSVSTSSRLKLRTASSSRTVSVRKSVSFAAAVAVEE